MNSDILDAFFTILSDANLGYPISWPNVDFTPPDSGNWLVVTHFPNKGLDFTLSSQSIIRQGILQVLICGRPGEGLIKLDGIAAEVAALFPKLTELSDVMVSRVPYVASAITADGARTELPLTIEYSK